MEIETRTERRRQRSPRRLRHEAEAKVFEDKGGSLEDIRLQLGLRPSQICEILKVHPSAWIRWTKSRRAPPHIYQMLEWYIELLSWRGQNHPIKEALLSRHVLRKEDPQTYVPEETPRIGEKGSNARVKVLTVIWCIQIFLWFIVMGILLKHNLR